MPWLLALAVATCTQDNMGPSHGGTGYFAFRPQYALAGGASLSQFGIVADSVHVLLTRPVDQVVLDTTVPFPADSGSLRLALPVVLESSPELLDAVIEISAGGVVIFVDSLQVSVKDGAPGNTPPPTATFQYVGPGSNIGTLDITPGDTTIVLGDSLFFTAAAFDSSDAPVANFYVRWSSSDTLVARVNGAGRLIAPALRGSVDVIGTTPTGIADTTTVIFAPVPVSIVRLAGQAQTGIVGDSLGTLFTARVKGADSLGVPGIKMEWIVSTPGGAVRDSVAYTDANGDVSTRAVLGTTAGPYTFTLMQSGAALATTFTATATPSTATAIAIQSGNAQVDTIGKTLAQPLVVRVTDAFTNPVPGAVVVFSRTTGTGLLADDSVTTDATGLASVAYTLGGTAGTDSIHALLAGTSAFVDFSASAISAAPTQIIQGLGSGQSAVAALPFTDSLTVQVLDVNDNPVSGIWVHWLVTSGDVTVDFDSVQTDANGHAAAKLTAGTVAGPAQVDATVTGIGSPVSFLVTVTAAAPASMTIISGNGQSGAAGIALPLSPEVIVRDAFSNPIAGITVDFAVTAGGGSIDSTTATTDSLGRANSGLWTLGAIAGANQVRATTGAVPADTLLFDATGLPAGTSKVWTGLSTSSWTDANSWSPIGVPGITDNVFIPASAPSPVLNASTTIGDLGIESGAGLSVNALLTVSGDVAVDGNIAGSGTIALTGSGTALHGTFGTGLITVNGTPTLDGPVSTGGPLTVASGLLTVGGNALTIGGNLTVSTAGQLAMTAAGDSVDVTGNVSYSTSTSGVGDLTAGVLVIRGNFAQTAGAFANFSASGTHTTRFAGGGIQTVSFSSPSAANSHFQNVDFASSGGITLGSNIAAQGSASVAVTAVTGIGRTAFLAGGLNASYAGWQVSTTQFDAAPGVYPDSLPRNVVLNGAFPLAHAFKVDSNLSITTTGVFTANGHTLRVGGTLLSNGVFRMQNTGDTVDVAKQFTASGGISGVGDLTGGVLILRGGFAQSAGAFANFQPSGSHTVRFQGTTGQTASFSSPSVSNSRFQNVEFADSVNFTTAVYVAGSASILAGGKAQSLNTATLAGPLSDPVNTGWRYANTTLTGTVTSLPDSMVTNVTLSGSWTLAQRTRISGTFTVGAANTFDLNGDTLIVSGGVTQGGIMTSTLPGGLLDVGGLTVNSGTVGTGSLTEGHLVLHGGFTQTAGAFANFAPSTNFLTTFAGTGGHTVSFSSPSAANSHFHHLEVFDSLTLTSSFTATGDVAIDTLGRMVSVNTGTLVAGLTDPSGLGYRMTNTNITGNQAIPDALTTNLTVSGAWTLPASFTLTGNLTIGGASVIDVNGHRLAVSGNLTQGGRLQTLTPSDSVEVFGGLTVNSSQVGTADMVDGRLILHQGLTQSAGAFANFAPSAGHVTEFIGTGGHAVSFSSPSYANSHFNHLVVRDSLTVGSSLAAIGTVTIDSTGRVMSVNTGLLQGDLVDASLAGWRMANTQLDGRFQTIPSALTSNVTLNDSIALAQNTSVTGNFTQQNNGYIAFSGHGLGVSGNFSQNSVLVMSSTQDSLDVGGTFTVSSSTTGAGNLTAGVIVLRGGFTQTAGSFTNFVGASPHRTRFTGPAPRTISMSTPTQTLFGDLEIDATGAITLANDIRALGTFTVTGGATLTSPVTQRLLRAGPLAVDGLTLDRVRIQSNSPSVNAAQFDNVTFLNQSPTLTQLSLELPGQTGDTLKFTNVTFNGTPTTGLYLFVADSVANDAPAVIGFYNSTPLNGALYTAVEGTVGDPATILWTHLDWVTQPADGLLGLPLVASPQVGVYDPSGNIVTGYTGTVTLGFFANPVGAVLGGNSVAAVGGVATYDSLTVSLAGTGFQLQASTSDLGVSPPSALFGITFPLPVGTTTAFNNSGGDNDWFNAANWTSGVPDSLDNAYIIPGQTAAVNAPAQVNRMIVGAGGGVLLNAPLTADSSVDAGNTITGGGQLVARGTGYLSGVTGGLLVNGNYAVPVNDTLVADYIVISGATAVLDPGSARIDAIDSLRTEAGGVLNVNDASAVVAVGRARFTGGFPALVTGTLEVHGDFSQEENVGAFSAGPAFTTVFNGGGTQTASFFSPDSSSDHFGNVTLTGGGTLHLAGATVPILGNLDIQGGTVVIDTTALLLGSLNGSTGAFAQGATLLLRDNFTFGGVYNVQNTYFIGTGQTIQQAITPFDTVYVQGSVALAGNVTANVFYVINFGQFDVGGRRLDVTADFGTGSGGIFTMDDPADSVIVGGTVYAMGGSTNGLLTDGYLQVAGSFYQGSTPADTIPVEVQGPPPALDAFRATGLHLTRFVGGPTAERIIFFGSPVQPADPFSTSNSRFGQLELVDGIDSVASTIPVDGDLLVSGAAVVNMVGGSGGPAVAGNVTVQAGVPQFTVNNVSLGGILDFQPSTALYQVGTTLFFGNGQTVPVLPYQDLEVAIGQATLAGDIAATNVRTGVAQEGPGLPGDLRLGGHTLTVSGNFTTTGNGSFTMDDPADSLDVTGGTDLGGGVTTNVTAGTLVARGDLYLSDSTLVASGTHRTVFASPTSQQLWITTGSTPTTQFNKLNILAGTTVNFNIFSSGPLQVLDTFAINGFFLQANPGKQVIALGDLYAGVAAGITVDEVELHKSLDIDASSYSVNLTRYAGAGQIVSRTTNYVNLEVTGTAALDSTVTVTGDAAVRNTGTLDLAGHRLNVGGTMALYEDGILTMTDPADTVDVGKTMLFDGGDTEGTLTDGVILTNYFTQLATGTSRSFRASGNHRVVLKMQDPDDAGININIATGGPADSRFNRLIFDSLASANAQVNVSGRVEVQDTFAIGANAAFGVYPQTPGATIHVNGPFVVASLVQNFVDTLDLGGPVQVATSIFQNPVVRFSGTGQAIPDTQSYNRLEITGTATPEGTDNVTASEVVVFGTGRLTLGAGQHVITNDFTTAEDGTLEMNGAGAGLNVFGNATFGGGSLAGLLLDGNISVGGNFTSIQGGTANDPFTSNNTGVTFTGSAVPQQVTLDPATNGLFRAIGVTNPNGIQINGLMIVTDSVGTSGPITGDSLYQFGNFFLNSGAQVNLKVLKTSGLLSGTPSVYAVGRTHIMNANTLPNVVFDTLVINASGVSAFYPLTANVLYVAGAGSEFSTGAPAFLDFGAIGSVVSHTITGDVHVVGPNAFLQIGEDTLSVGGDFHTTFTGRLMMDGAGGGLLVGGSAVFGGGSEAGLLTTGVLQIQGGITQTAEWSPSSFRIDGTALDLPLGPAHALTFETPDSSYLPDLSLPSAGTLSLVINGTARVAGGISAYGISISGDTLITDGQLSGGPSGLAVNLQRYEGPVFYQFQTVTDWTVRTTQFTGPGALPFSTTFTFDTLLVSDSVIGQLSQLLKASYVEVTGPGNPRHIGAEPGVLVLSGGDGNTTLDVTGDVVVRGDGAGIASYEGNLSATGLVVDQLGYLSSNGGFGGASWTINGNVLIDGASTVDSLVRGTMSIGGNFFQANSKSDESWAPDSGFTTVFFGGGTHVVQFATPGPAGTGSHFGSLGFNPDAGLVMQTDTDLWVEGLLTTTSYANPVLQNTTPLLKTITVQDVAIQGVTFDHLQLNLVKTAAPTIGADNMDIVNFTNFLTTEDQFTASLPGLAVGAFSWSNFTFTQLATDGSDTGHYFVATDGDGIFPFLGINIGSNQTTSGELGYYVGLNGAIVTPFAP